MARLPGSSPRAVKVCVARDADSFLLSHLPNDFMVIRKGKIHLVHMQIIAASLAHQNSRAMRQILVQKKPHSTPNCG
jgi:hypothetical protein